MSSIDSAFVAIDNEDTQKDKYLTFHLAGEDYGIEIRFVIEIIGIQKITEVPDMPDFIRGVINLRGKVIPVIDLRLRFGMPQAEYTDRTCIIVVDVTTSAGELQMGIVVDSVSEVLNIKPEEIDPTPSFGTNLQTEYIMGMAKMDAGVKILLDINQVLNQDETELLRKVA